MDLAKAGNFVATDEETSLGEDLSSKQLYSQDNNNESMYTKYSQVKYTSSHSTEVARKLGLAVFCNHGFVMITLVLCTTLPIANIVMGSVYFHDCPVEPMITIYLVVGGCFLLFRSLLNITELVYRNRSKMKDLDYKRPLFYACCDLPLWIFLFAWFIAGNVWIYSVRDAVQFGDADREDYCHQTLYLYAFWFTIVTYVLVLAPIILCLSVSAVAYLGCMEYVESRF